MYCDETLVVFVPACMFDDAGRGLTRLHREINARVR